MQSSGFFNADIVDGKYDKVYLAESFAEYFSTFIGNGVFGKKLNELQVKAMSEPEMKVQVLSGYGWINGYWYKNDDAYELPIDVADGVFSRVDAIVLRYAVSKREITLEVKKGEPGLEPQVPELQRDSEIYELMLAKIKLNAGDPNIQQVGIEDTRLNTEVCGLVTGVIDQVDSTGLGEQLQGFINEYIEKSNGEYDNFVKELNSLFENAKIDLTLLIEELDKLLDEGVASGLQQQIDELKKNDFSALSAKVNENASKISILWDAVFTQINKNPFNIVFSDLNGINITAGVYNETQHRLEC